MAEARRIAPGPEHAGVKEDRHVECPRLLVQAEKAFLVRIPAVGNQLDAGDAEILACMLDKFKGAFHGRVDPSQAHDAVRKSGDDLAEVLDVPRLLLDRRRNRELLSRFGAHIRERDVRRLDADERRAIEAVLVEPSGDGHGGFLSREMDVCVEDLHRLPFSHLFWWRETYRVRAGTEAPGSRRSWCT